jgi:SPP1 gp7 family putative phage head morphogenesis protein
MKDMDFRQLREYARELILAAIGVPPFMAGVLDKANYANAREQREMYWMGPQTRFLAEVQACLNHDFLPKLGVKGVELYPCWEKVKALLENLAEKVEVATKLFAMGVPIRQINDRLELGLEIDDLDTADTGFLPFNLVPVEQVLNPPEPMALPASDSPEDDDGKAPVPSKRLALVTRDEAKRATQWRTIVARARDVEMRFNTTLRKHFHAIEREVLENLNGIKGWQAKQKWPNKATTADLVFNPREAKAALIAVTAPLQKIAVVRGADSVLGDLAADVSFSVTDPAVIGKLAELSHKITRIDSTIEAALGESLSQGLNAGESIGQLSERVRNVMQATRARSMAIARTETGFAFNTGRYEGMKQAGIERQEWLTARDTSVRESHASIDGQVVMLGEPFTLGSGVTILYPLDPSGPASEVINCRCVAVPVIGG